jgi:hypothetical protein
MTKDRIRLERAFEIYLRLKGFDRATRQTRLQKYGDLMAMGKGSQTVDIHLDDHYFVAHRDESGYYITRDEFRVILQGLQPGAEASRQS